MSPAKWSTRTTIVVETVAAILAVAALVIALVAVVISANADRRDQQRDRDAFCGLVVPIAQQQAATGLGRTIVAAAQHAAVVIQCTGGRR